VDNWKRYKYEYNHEEYPKCALIQTKVCVRSAKQEWKHSALTIDPKGEAAEKAAQWRADLGQSVHVLDPFRSARVPEKFYACYNPLDDLDPNGLSIKEDLAAIADGIVMRRDAGAV
jgi:type IV secretory pathway TraG/TraD family ATPase VirD4